MKEDTPERIPQHRHCMNCGRAFSGDGRYCSEECDSKRTDELKKKKNKLIIVWVVAVVIMIGCIITLL